MKKSYEAQNENLRKMINDNKNNSDVIYNRIIKRVNKLPTNSDKQNINKIKNLKNFLKKK